MDYQSWLIYTLFMIVSCTLAFQAERKDYNIIWVSLTYLVVTGFWAIRYQIGFDYVGYMDIFTAVKYNRFTFVESGYYYLNKLFSFSKYGYVYVIAISTIIIYLLLFKMLIYRKILTYGLFFSLGFQFQFMAANQMRQALVIAGFLYATRYIEEKRYWPYVFWLLGLMVFHSTAIFMLLAIPMSKIRLPKTIAIGLLMISFVLLQLGVFKTLGTTILRSVPFYEQYQTMEGRMQAEEVGFSIVMLFYFVVACMLILYRDTINYPTISNIYILGFIAYVMFFDFHLLNRMMQYFTMLNIILAAYLCKHSLNRGILLVIVTFFAYGLLSMKIPNLHGIQPYQTVFNKRLERI